jgi:hypothetical protein
MSDSGKAVFLSHASHSFALFDRRRAPEGTQAATSEDFL